MAAKLDFSSTNVIFLWQLKHMYSLIIEIQVWTPTFFSNIIESKDNAENKIYRVISEAILKKANLGTPRNFLVFFFPVKYMS